MKVKDGLGSDISEVPRGEVLIDAIFGPRCRAAKKVRGGGDQAGTIRSSTGINGTIEKYGCTGVPNSI